MGRGSGEEGEEREKERKEDEKYEVHKIMSWKECSSYFLEGWLPWHPVPLVPARWSVIPQQRIGQFQAGSGLAQQRIGQFLAGSGLAQ